MTPTDPTNPTDDRRTTTARTDDRPTAARTEPPAEREHLTELRSAAPMVPDLRSTGTTTTATKTMDTTTATRTTDEPTEPETDGRIERELTELRTQLDRIERALEGERR